MCAGSARAPQRRRAARPLPLPAVLEQPGWAELGAAAPWGAKTPRGFLPLLLAAGTGGDGCVRRPGLPVLQRDSSRARGPQVGGHAQ